VSNRTISVGGEEPSRVSNRTISVGGEAGGGVSNRTICWGSGPVGCQTGLSIGGVARGRGPVGCQTGLFLLEEWQGPSKDGLFLSLERDRLATPTS
jgi:hypothetical protein